MRKKNWFTKLPTWAKVLVAIVPLLIFWKLFRNGWKLGKDIGNAVKNDQQTAAIAKVAQSAGIDATRSQDIINISADIHKAFYGLLWGLGEDEEAAVLAMNRCRSTGEAKAVAMVYRTNYEKSLYDDFKKYSGTFIDPWPKQNLMDAIKGL